MKKLGNLYFHGNRNKNRVALTFDDGPSKETLEILKILKDYNTKATFFICGKKLKTNESILEKIIKGGHEIGNHSYDHYKLLFKNKRKIYYQIKRTDKELEKFGIRTNLFRPPAFKIGINLLKTCKGLNKKIILCDVSSRDWKKPGIEKTIYRILRKTKNGSIINLHDYTEGIGANEEIIPTLKKIIPKLQEKGYEMVTVSELLTLLKFPNQAN